MSTSEANNGWLDQGRTYLLADSPNLTPKPTFFEISLEDEHRRFLPLSTSGFRQRRAACSKREPAEHDQTLARLVSVLLFRITQTLDNSRRRKECREDLTEGWRVDGR